MKRVRELHAGEEIADELGGASADPYGESDRIALEALRGELAEAQQIIEGQSKTIASLESDKKRLEAAIQAHRDELDRARFERNTAVAKLHDAQRRLGRRPTPGEPPDTEDTLENAIALASAFNRR